MDLEDETHADLERQLDEAKSNGDLAAQENLTANLAASEERMEVLVTRFMRTTTAQQTCDAECTQVGSA